MSAPCALTCDENDGPDIALVNGEPAMLCPRYRNSCGIRGQASSG